MRPIKFRAWDSDACRYFVPVFRANAGHLKELVLALSGELQMRTLDANIHCPSMWPDRFLVEQFTGLHDKNGKEIYEGDIVRAYTYFDDETKELCDSTVHEIVWVGDYPAFELKPPADDETNSLQLFASIQPEGEKIEVIGNIHENPELCSQTPNATV